MAPAFAALRRILPRTWPLLATTRFSEFFNAIVDTVVRRPCHEISRDFAVQQTQRNYKIAVGLILAVLLAPSISLAGIAVRGAPQPLLHDGTSGPCDPGLMGPDYVPGVDVNGNPVRPADLAGRRNPVPDSVLMPLKKQDRHGQVEEGPVVALDGRALEPILNPPPGCPPARR